MRVRQIDALRGIAALLVAGVFHIHFLLGGYRTGPLDGLQPFTWLHDYGWTLVDLFFVISGFIFSRVYLVDGRLKGSIRDFAIARFARLYPLQLATLLVAAAIGMAGDARHFVLNLLMLQESGLNDGISFNFPVWSISIELYCYLLFALAARRGILLQLAPALILLGVALTLGDVSTLDHVGRGLVGFFVGVLICSRSARPALLAAIAVAALAVPHWAPLSRGAAYSLTLWPAIVLLALKTPLSLQWLGDRSYSIYLWHAPVYFALRPLTVAGQWPAMVIGLAVMLAIADLSFRFLERPARGMLKRQLSSRELEPYLRPST